jgi:hypothetical protein
MIHPHTELRFISPEIGFGVVATRLIPRGTITWVRDAFDRAYPRDEVHAAPALLRKQVDKYAYGQADGRLVLCWDHARYVNHACEPSCIGVRWDLELATRDIHPGEELTDDYGQFFLDEPFDCLCGSPSCRRSVQPGDRALMAPTWSRLFAEAFVRLEQVEQPMWAVVDPAVQTEVLRSARGEAPVPTLSPSQPALR